MTRPAVHAVVLAGGAGTRFWPLSREQKPKPLLQLAGQGSLLRQTLARAGHVAAPQDTWLVCGESHAAGMRRESGLAPGRVLVEPRMRNTAAAICLAATRIAAQDPEALMVVLPADHRIPDTRSFARAIRRAARAAAAAEALVTVGIQPTRPETGYGYIRLGRAEPSHEGLYRVSRFVEKPTAPRARRLLAAEGTFWNAGIFVWRAQTILDELAKHAPRVFRAFAPVRAVLPGGRGLRDAVQRAYRRVPSVAIDRAVLERSSKVWCLPVEFSWSDVGTWRTLAEDLGVSPNVTKVISGEALLSDAKGNLVYGSDRPIVLLGVEGLAVIDAGDAVLVADLERSGEVRQLVDRLRKTGRDDLV
jgi:mannose-1-phosphate guanylyltransferase/mannose-6-phosphate isomerase